MKKNKSFMRPSALIALSLIGSTALSTHAFAREVTLTSGDGSVNMTGEFIDFSDNAYTIETELGTLRVSANRVQCSGEACPDLDGGEADVTVAGSETIGVGLMPLLLEGYAGSIEAAATVGTTQGGDILAQMVADDGFGVELDSFMVDSTGSQQAFESLLDASAQIAMSSRRILPAEAQALREAGAGNMISPQQEHIIAVDSLIVITHPSNPVQTLTMEQLAGIYSDEITNWSQLGGEDAPITVMHRKEGTGTRDVFMDRVFGEADPYLPFSVLAQDSGQMAALVNNDEHAIGYVGYAFQRGAQPVTLVNQCGLSMTPDAFSARTEEYALQRRLYLYTREDADNETIQAFLDFATSDAADNVIGKAGFIGLGIDRRAQSLDDSRAMSLLNTEVDAYEGQSMREMLAQMIEYDRLSTTFRFRTGSSRLDERGMIDMENLARYLEGQGPGTEVMFVGFTDSVGQFDSNRLLSENRSAEVLGQMRDYAGDRLTHIDFSSIGYGEIAPSGCNVTDEGRSINRRVEIWIRSAT